MITASDVTLRFEEYISKEDPSISSFFIDYKSVPVFAAETLSDAWLMARPDDDYKFADEEFKSFVNEATGKWLEKRTPDEPYKIILAIGNETDIDRVVKTYIHELRHVMDYANAVQGMNFRDYSPGDRYFTCYSEYNAEKSATRYWVKCCLERNVFSSPFECLSSLLGYFTADALHGAMKSSGIKDISYFISRYLGAQRSIRDLSMEIAPSPVFHLWSMTPSIIAERYGTPFYLANEWDEKTKCPLVGSSSLYFNELINRIMATERELHSNV